jgi:hypothetical protein
MTLEQEQVIEESNMYTGEWSLRDYDCGTI